MGLDLTHYTCSACEKAFAIARDMGRYLVAHNREGFEEGHDGEPEVRPDCGGEQREEEQGKAEFGKKVVKVGRLRLRLELTYREIAEMRRKLEEEVKKNR